MEQAAGSGEAHPGRLDDQAYADMITEEARVWSENAAKDAEEWLPDWRAYKETWPYKTYRRKWTQLFFDTIPSGSAVLEIGCGVGWFAIELARRGCHVRALDVAEGTLAIAGDYLSTLEGTEGLSGSLTFELRDVTVAGLGSEDEYDFVVTRGVLHHLPDAEGVLQEIVRVLKQGGVLLVDDGRRTGRLEATLVALLLTLLPTEMTYRRKLTHIWRNRKRVVTKAQAFIDREGDSPFEGVTRDADELVHQYFDVTFSRTFAAVVGSLASQVRLPRPFKHGLLWAATFADERLVRLGLLHGSNFVMFAEPRSPELARPGMSARRRSPG